MKRKYLIISLVLFVFLVSVTSVCAQDNGTDIMGQVVDDENVMAVSNEDEKLEKTYFYDADVDESYVDDTVVTHNVVKYYGDEDTKFKVKVYDEDYYPEEGVYVSFRIDFGNYKEKTTNSNGIVYFPLNYDVGEHSVETYIESDDGRSYWSADNTVTIKSTIPTKELVKYSTSHKKFKIRFLDTKGHALKNKVVKIKKNGYWYKFKTNSNGYIKIRSTFKVGKHKITAYNPVSKEKRKISVVVLKKGTHKVNVKFHKSESGAGVKKLKNGDGLYTIYSTKYGQYYPGAYVQGFSSGIELPKHTKIIKAKFFFKNKKTGKVITKTSKNGGYAINVNLVNGYIPYKVTVWYKDKIKA